MHSAAPPPAGPREYDPEINDMAGYIHNYKVDSDLAVSELSLSRKIVVVIS
jgi:2-methylcitrate dehydratase